MKFSNSPKKGEGDVAKSSSPPVSSTASPEDLLGPSKEPVKEPPKAPAKAVPPSPAPAASAPPLPRKDETPQEIEKRLQAEALTATEIYSRAVTAARDIHKALEDPLASPSLEIPTDILRRLIQVVASDNQEILTLADRSAPDNYLHGHVVNVTIFSLRLGVSQKLSDNELLLLATGAFLHDIGMVTYMPMVLKPARLSEDELRKVQKHAEEGVKMLSNFPALTGSLMQEVSLIVSQVHERMEGMGYPSSLGQNDTNRLAKIVGVCDMYESLTHMRAWRSRLLPHHVLRVMIEEHERTFEPGVVKSLVEALSLYPPGSFVRLSTGEVGRVVAVNQGLPTRPKVKVLVDQKGQRLPEPRIVNMASNPILYIADAVDETKLPTSDQRLLLELRAQRWWVKGL